MNTGAAPAGLLRQAQKHYRDGDNRRAHELCVDVLAAEPENVAALCLMANLSLASGDPVDAERYARQALAAGSHQAIAYNLLGRALNNQRCLEDAATAFEQVLLIDANHIEAMDNLAHVRRQQGDLTAAEQLWRQVISRDADYARGWKNLGITYSLMGRPAQAARMLQRSVAIDTDDAMTHFNLGNALTELGRSDEAICAFEQAAALQPDDPDALSNLGAALQTAGRIDSARQCFERALELQPGHAPAMAALAGIFDLEGDTERGLELLEDPTVADQAIVVVAHAQLSRRLKRNLVQSAQRLEALIAGGLPQHLQHTVHFTLGDICDDLSEYDRAFGHYKAANDLRKGGFDRVAYTRFVDMLLAAFSGARLKQIPDSGVDSQLPVFIVGMPRSGTTLVEQICAAHPQVHGAGELADIGRVAAAIAGNDPAQYAERLAVISRHSLAAAANEYLQQLARLAPAAARITDKMWQNFEHLGLISKLFPGARVIHCSRDPMDTGLSCFFQSFGSTGAAFANDLDDIGFYYRQYRRFMDTWNDTLNLQIFEVQYEELVQQQEQISRQLINFIGLPWDEACLEFYEEERIINTASYAQVSKPIYTRSINRHHHYIKHLTPLAESLASANDH